jgi:hypothetical protein
MEGKIAPALMRLSISRLKLEKVVNPPQNPVPNRRYVSMRKDDDSLSR